MSRKFEHKHTGRYGFDRRTIDRMLVGTPPSRHMTFSVGVFEYKRTERMQKDVPTAAVVRVVGDATPEGAQRVLTACDRIVGGADGWDVRRPEARPGLTTLAALQGRRPR